MIKRVLAVLGLMILGLVTGGQAANAASNPFDPSPYCRPYIGRPYVDSGPTYTGGGRYQWDTEAAGGMTCNGSAYSVSVSVTLHYSTDPSSGGSGATTGATHTCGGSCEATAHYLRASLWCGYHYTYDDYATVHYTWKRNSSSTAVSGSMTGGHTTGSSYDPPGVCT